MVLISPGDVHREIAKTPYRAVMFEIDALLDRDHGRWPGTMVVHSPTLRDATMELVESIRSDLTTQERLAARLLRLVASLGRRASSCDEPPLVTRARRVLMESPTPVSLDELARRLRCAPTYLCRVFLQHTGVGPHAYQLQQRLLDARRLVEGGRTVAAAAALTGFGDESNLRRHFRRRFAVAPGQYQRSLSPRASAVVTSHSAAARIAAGVHVV